MRASIFPGILLAFGVASAAEPATTAPTAAAIPPAASPSAESPPAVPPRPAISVPVESLAWQRLRDVADRERAVWSRLKQHPNDDDEQKRAATEFRDILTSYENIIHASPDFAEAYAAYGLLLGRVGNRAAATKAFVRSNKLNPNNPVVKNQLGNILLEDGNYKEALAYYLSAIELDGEEPLYHYQLGSLLTEYRSFFINDGLFDRATLDAKMQTAFHRAAELAPDNWPYAYRYAESFSDLDKPDWTAALVEWQKIEPKAKAGVERQTILLQEANVLLKLDRRSEARALIDEVTEPVLAENKAKLVAMLDEAEKK